MSLSKIQTIVRKVMSLPTHVQISISNKLGFLEDGDWLLNQEQSLKKFFEKVRDNNLIDKLASELEKEEYSRFFH